MQLYSGSLMERLGVGTEWQKCRFKRQEYVGSPIDAVDMDFLKDRSGGYESLGNIMSRESTQNTAVGW